MRAAVIGSGIGGLCAAIGLRRAGAEVVVFERAADLRPGGSGLSLFGNGIRALASLGVELMGVTSPEAAMMRGGQRRPDGSWLSTYPGDALAQLRIVDRADLHAVLRAAVPVGVVRGGHEVTAVSPDGEVTRVGPDGAHKTDRFDVVVAADGLRSTVRPTFGDDPGVRYAGYSTWRAITDRPVDLHGEAGETWGVGRRFGIAPLADGRVYWFAVVTAVPGVPVDDDLAALRTLFGAWHDPIPELIESTRPEAIHYLPIEELAGTLGSFVHGRIALLGDAAHAMTPNLGQGGGQAMEDAATLAALLAPLAEDATPDPVAVRATLGRYDALRRPRSQRIARRSRMIGRLAHVRGRVLSRARDAAVAATPASVLRRQLDGLQSWEPPA
ncbi:FAD-dependent monooxygenase [Microbacterium invictum]|uniref:2-polyprenyl-6-methoxyphenol hydroxylase-like FAD-dependent oxidoreductase n=1 Tax=Microbacterium invictum TaxID=515415 RepID=A0AA40SLR1_9MICO|nr:FAD-dependent monooxygenase [Microbacterium invictum]MBB4138565.1 2-polyprenyl-6-methoxyphenol hydroxylase-like FAD-dependent oxidoreductase [Microbacterium invictum]